MLNESLWAGLLLWVSLYVADYALTLICARMYRAGVQDVFGYEGSFELTPYFQGDIDALRALSPRFIVALVWGVAILSWFWWLSSRLLIPPQAYQFVLGAMVLVELAVHVRHARNTFLFRAILAGGAVSGRVEYRRAAILRTSAIEIAAFAAVYLIIFLASWSWFSLGGTFGCASQAWKQARLARRAQAAPRQRSNTG